ncbi:MAG: NYN domain-containing protein [Bacteroidetes bacterium]|nr:NYN domain-containing protein [Bacteroidota bacterium]
MSNHSRSNASPTSHAFMFIDYENLFTYIEQNSIDRTHPKYVINSLLNSALHYVKQDLQFNLGTPVAYADFSLIDSGKPEIQQNLYLAGMEPRFVPASLQSNASEIQICLDVLELMQTQNDIPALFLVTGNRLYLPLIKYCRQRNMQSTAITFQPPELNYADEHSEFFIHADRFLEQTIHAYHDEEYSMEPQVPSQGLGLLTPPEKVTEVTDETALIALEIIDRWFGQYEEVYMTPLLRKLSEMLGGHDNPKLLVNKLEEAGAVWLEKRKGYPYNYTVLLINYNHPNVMLIQSTEDEYMNDG